MAASTKTWLNNNPPSVEDDDLNGFAAENNNLILGSGQALSIADSQQTHKAVSVYAHGGNFYTDGGVADAYILSTVGAKVAPPSYFVGMRIRFIAGNSNTGASTINVASLGVENLKRIDGSDRIADDLLTGESYEFEYNGIDFIEVAARQEKIYAAEFLQTVSDINNGSEVSVFRFIDPEKHAGIRAGTNTDDLYDEINDGVGSGAAALLFPFGTYHHETGIIFPCSVRGEGMPRIKSVGDIASVTFSKQYGYLRDIRIEPDGTGGTSNHGLIIAGAARSVVGNITLTGTKGDAIRLDSSVSSNNKMMLNNVHGIIGDGDGLHVIAGVDNNSILFNNLSMNAFGGTGFHVDDVFFAGNAFNLVSLEDNTVRGLYFNGASCRNNAGTVYVEGNGVADIEFSANAHTNFITTTNDGSVRIDNNGTNTILTAGSGPTQRYNFNDIAANLFRLANFTDIGQLTMEHTGDRAWEFAMQASGIGNITLSKGTGSALNLDVQGRINGRKITPADLATSISVNDGNLLELNNSAPTNVAVLSGGVIGQELSIVFLNANSTIVSGSVIRLAGGANFAGGFFDTLKLVYNSPDWHEISRSVNA